MSGGFDIRHIRLGYVWAHCREKRRMHLIAPMLGVTSRALCGEEIVVASYPDTLKVRPRCAGCKRAAGISTKAQPTGNTPQPQDSIEDALRDQDRGDRNSLEDGKHIASDGDEP